MNDILAGKRVLITGASRGLGREIAHAMWCAGATLLLAARSAEALRELATELAAGARGGQQVATVAVDLASPADVARLVEHARRTWDRLDVLVNNAAIVGPIGRAWENDWQAWQTALQVNLLAPVELCRALVPWMIKRGGGRIVNLSGGGATSPRPSFSAYATSKAALVRFSEVLAEEVQDANIQVNCIAPGAMNTAMNQAVLAAGPDKVGAVEYERARTLADKNGPLPAQAADLAVFLASPASDRITGKLISAVWDPWRNLGEHAHELQRSDIYTLRRIVPGDRGLKWE